MVGITSYGGYLPHRFLERKRIFQALGWFNPATYSASRGLKSVANHDEDSITMAVAACRKAFASEQAEGVDALYFASTSMPFKERQNAAIVAAALNTKKGIHSVDVTGSLRAATGALLDAVHGIEASSSRHALVVAADTRLAKMGSNNEHMFGDAAAAVMLGAQDCVAELIGSVSLCGDFPDHVRADIDHFDRMWEERWLHSEGYTKTFMQAAKALVERCHINIGDVDHWVFACPASKVVSGIAKKLKIDPQRLQDNLIEQVGDCGSALPLLMLSAVLERAKPHEKIAVISYGSGSDALLFEVTDAMPAIQQKQTRLAAQLASRTPLDSYEKYCVFRRLLPLDVGIRGEANPITAHSVLARESASILGLVGARCRACETAQYPPQRYCVNPACDAVDNMDPYAFANRQAHVFTYTGDNLAFSLDPPAIYGLVDFSEGGRMQLDFTDCSLTDVQVGMPIELTFRRKYVDQDRGMIGYFWKARPQHTPTEA